MNERMDRWMFGYMDEYVEGLLDIGWVDEWIVGLKDGW
jgi:hypothetical protein